MLNINIVMNNYNYSLSRKNTQIKSNAINFEGRVAKFPLQKAYSIEPVLRTVEMSFRKTANRIANKAQSKLIDNVHSKIQEIPIDSPLYMQAIGDLSKMMTMHQEVEVNAGIGTLNSLNKAIQDIASSDESCIFIMNHDNQSKDPKLLSLFNALLAKEYVLQGKAQNCPRPKIVLNEDILLSTKPKMREIYEWSGAVGVDASIGESRAKSRKNSKVMITLMRSFAENKSNIFIFPEGKLCIRKDLNIYERFQVGIGDLIRSVAEKKGRVKVVPLGFAYKKKRTGFKKEIFKSIFIGEPIFIAPKEKNMAISSSNVGAESDMINLKRFFDKKPEMENKGISYYTFTKKGIPIEDRHQQSDLISLFLAENLRLCIEKAKKFLGRDSELVEI